HHSGRSLFKGDFNDNVSVSSGKYTLTSDFEKKWQQIERLKIAKNERSLSLTEQRRQNKEKTKEFYKVSTSKTTLNEQFKYMSMASTKSPQSSIANRLQNMKQGHIFSFSEKN